MQTAQAPGPTYAQKLADAIAYLGPRWVLHPQYKPLPQHTLYPRIVR